MGLFAKLREKRRERLFARESIPAGDMDELFREYPFLARLRDEERLALRKLATAFFHEKQWLGQDDREVPEALRFKISAFACLPVLKLGLDRYRGWSTILIVPDGFRREWTEYDASGVAVDREDESSGEVLEFGTVVFSGPDVDDAGRCGGYNVVIHEMAHVLDGLDGSFDGMPPLTRGMDREEWAREFSAAFGHFSRSLETRERRKGRRKSGPRGNRPAGRRSGALGRIDPYAADSPSEYFAVMCEHFFETPEVVHEAYPAVYRLLSEYFGQEPLR